MQPHRSQSRRRMETLNLRVLVGELKDSGLSSVEIAERVGCSSRHVDNILRARRKGDSDNRSYVNSRPVFAQEIEA